MWCRMNSPGSIKTCFLYKRYIDLPWGVRSSYQSIFLWQAESFEFPSLRVWISIFVPAPCGVAWIPLELLSWVGRQNVKLAASFSVKSLERLKLARGKSTEIQADVRDLGAIQWQGRTASDATKEMVRGIIASIQPRAYRDYILSAE